VAFPGRPPLRPSLARLKRWGTAGLDLLYPRVCHGCDLTLPFDAPREGLGAWFCGECEEALPRIEAPYCMLCAEAYDGAVSTTFRCENCAGRDLAFDFAFAGFRSEGPVRELIHRFKYERRYELRGVLSVLLKETLNESRLVGENLADWVLTPVPLHPSRQSEREFNQSWELCCELSGATSIPAKQALIRVRDTEHQARMNRRERLANLRKAFAPDPGRWGSPAAVWRGKKVLLVDDVVTTGTTTHECAKVLVQQMGVQKVVVIAIARG
jgi:competence protein ComFC